VSLTPQLKFIDVHVKAQIFEGWDKAREIVARRPWEDNDKETPGGPFQGFFSN